MQKEAELSVTGVWVVGAVPDQEVRNLLSASAQSSVPAPVHFHAASTGSGAAGQVRWY